MGWHSGHDAQGRNLSGWIYPMRTPRERAAVVPTTRQTIFTLTGHGGLLCQHEVLPVSWGHPGCCTIFRGWTGGILKAGSPVGWWPHYTGARAKRRHLGSQRPGRTGSKGEMGRGLPVCNAAGHLSLQPPLPEDCELEESPRLSLCALESKAPAAQRPGR